METQKPEADYVLFYAKVRSFLEDGCCTLKHTCRRIFEQMAVDRGLSIEKYSADLDTSERSSTAQNGGGGHSRRRRGASKAAYRAFYWAFTASDAALMSEAEFVKMRLPLKDHAGNPLAVCDQLPEREDCYCSLGCRPFEAPDDDCGQEHPLNDRRLDFITAPFVQSKRHLFYGAPSDPATSKTAGPVIDGLVDGTEAKKAEMVASGGSGSISLTDAQRIYLTHSLLNRLDIRKELRRVLGPHPGTELCTVDCIYCRRLKRRIFKNDPIVLEHLLDARIFADAFALHEEAESSWLRASANRKCASACCLCGCCGRRDDASVSPEEPAGSQEIPEMTSASVTGPQPGIGGAARQARTRDLRRRLHKTWSCCCSFQPLRLIRLYFGERLAFYFAWLGYLVCSLMSLTAVGLAFLVYGLVNASLNYKTESEKLLAVLRNSTSSYTVGNEFTVFLIELMQFVRLLFENSLTIPFGCVLTAWSLSAAKYWKKYEGQLSHRWDVHEWHLAEKRRPGFSPKKKMYYPACCQKRNECRRCFGVLSFVLLCVTAVVAVAVGFEVAKLVASQRHCSSSNSRAECIFLSIILPITGHLLIMGLLDWGYSRLAKKLTDWENHDFDSDYDASYAIKAFVLRSANNYASLFYIAFVRQEHASFGEFTDRCTLDKIDVDCFSLLNIYTAGYIIGKSLIKSITDFLRSCLASRSLMRCLSAPARRFLCTACAGFKRAAYAAELRTVTELERQQLQERKAAEPATPGSSSGKGKSPATAQRLARERGMTKEKSRDLLLDEYLEKTTLHGYMVLFGSACYLTPLAVLIALLIDLRLDSRRLVMYHRRPVPHPASGIGAQWNRLQDMLNHAGIFSTSAILAFTTNSLQVHGFEVNTTNRLILFIVFSGVMQLYKYFITSCAEAQSSTLKMRLKWEYFHVPRILDTETVPEDAVRSLDDLQNRGRWYHVLFPCFAGPTRLRPEVGPHQA